MGNLRRVGLAAQRLVRGEMQNMKLRTAKTWTLVALALATCAVAISAASARPRNGANSSGGKGGVPDGAHVTDAALKAAALHSNLKSKRSLAEAAPFGFARGRRDDGTQV